MLSLPVVSWMPHFNLLLLLFPQIIEDHWSFLLKKKLFTTRVKIRGQTFFREITGMNIVTTASRVGSRKRN